MKKALLISLILLIAFFVNILADYEGCIKKDHDYCDKLCKLDSYWYGVCKFNTDDNFMCLCWRYKQPLQSTVCTPDIHKYCNGECVRLYKHEGYCYPHGTTESPSGIPRCYCFAQNYA